MSTRKKQTVRWMSFVACMVFLYLLTKQVSACGIDWKLPANHFNGVSSKGDVAYWEKIADVDLGENLKVPIVIGFRSNKENGTPSPYLGQGWILPLLESNIVQTGDNSFLMMQPDGWNNMFIRAKSDDAVLDGSAGWKGEIRGDIINVWAPCGWKIEVQLIFGPFCCLVC